MISALRWAARRIAGTTARQLMGTLTQVATDQPLIALTFDDGPHPEYTPRLLDILKRHQALATFFMVGSCALTSPQIVRRAAAEGHAIGNHTFDHRQMPAISRVERFSQLDACQRALHPYAQKLFRPPKGRQSIGSRFDLLCTGYQVVTWNIHVEDWLPRDPQWMAERMIGDIRPGSIVLLHDSIWDPMVAGAEDRTATLTAVETVLRRLGDHYRFVTVPELLRSGEPILEHWYLPPVPETQPSTTGVVLS